VRVEIAVVSVGITFVRVKITMRVKITFCVYKSHSLVSYQNHSKSLKITQNHSKSLEITLVSVEITVVSVFITFVRVKVTMHGEITLCV
jgi:hypothetical protein